MELKQFKNYLISVLRILLIVPYGIETYLQTQAENGQGLLIVPYGIETLH